MEASMYLIQGIQGIHGLVYGMLLATMIKRMA